jgi:flagellar motor switch protein FliM
MYSWNNKIITPNHFTEVLSQDQIDILLSKINLKDDDIDDSDDGVDSFFPPTSQSFVKKISSTRRRQFKMTQSNSKKIKIYDFCRPDNLTRKDIRQFYYCADYMAHQVLNTIQKNKISTEASIHVASVDQLTFEEFCRSVPCPTYIMRFCINCNGSFIGRGLIEFDPIIVQSMIHYSFGGSSQTITKQTIFPLTQLEEETMSYWTHLYLDSLFKKMSAENLKFEYSNLVYYNSPQYFESETKSSHMQCLVTMEANFFETEGMINMSFDYEVIQQMKLQQKIQKTQEIKIFPKDTIIGLRAVLGGIKKTVAEIDNMTVGMIISGTAQNNELYANNSLIAFGEIKNNMVHSTIKVTKLAGEKKNMVMNSRDFERTGLRDMEVNIAVELGRTTMTLGELERLSEGTLIELNKLSGEPVDIYANNALIAKGEVCVTDEIFTIRVTDVIGSGDLPE